ncbi:MAG: class I SAM-dependent methyltransferase [Calditrichaeota bacterium]|nr:class I SAM-dependent methyltransferase [Calditrichota bacterium]
MNSQISKESNLHFFESRAEEWDFDESPDKIRRLESIFDEIPVTGSRHVLDIGAGTGILVPILSTRLDANAGLVELDFSKAMIRQNYRRWKECSDRIYHITGDTQILPLQDKSFHFVVCFAVFPHIGEPEKAIDEWKRILLPGGSLLILHLMGSACLNRMHRETGDAVARDVLLPAEKLASLLSRHGFKIERQNEADDIYLILARK